ncbi:hypothetical protein OHA72_47725 [Dactylosporangium sp. NBC_01737]|uniref:hypothetical protein n=1 Tax=Dactylosporangium sp. NBC_01737 TaxID=2975959 RepID=UPI002E0E3EE9|nr:hypothetical protein OHA72_47725 [Dactylosporangium sp. NBC_01737]
MLTPAWYLTDANWFGLLPDARRLDDGSQDLIGGIARLLGDEAGFSPAQTVAATHVILLAVEHLGDTITHAVTQHDRAELARLLCGLNLIQAHLAQTIQRMAESVDGRNLRALDTAPAAALQALTNSLSTAGANGELTAGHLKEAHLTLHGLSR